MLTRRTLLQGVLSLAALGPLARVAVAEERRQREREEFIVQEFQKAVRVAFADAPLYCFAEDGVWELGKGEPRKIGAGEEIAIGGTTYRVEP